MMKLGEEYYHYHDSDYEGGEQVAGQVAGEVQIRRDNEHILVPVTGKPDRDELQVHANELYVQIKFDYTAFILRNL